MPVRPRWKRRSVSPFWLSVLMLCLAGIAAVSMQVRCIDAAREAARLAARGDERSAVAAPAGSRPAAPSCSCTGTADSSSRRSLPGRICCPRCTSRPPGCRRSSRRDERGSATVVAAAMVVVLLSVTGGCACLGAAVVARHRAQAAADLAALAAAARLPAGRRGSLRAGRRGGPGDAGRNGRLRCRRPRRRRHHRGGPGGRPMGYGAGRRPRRPGLVGRRPGRLRRARPVSATATRPARQRRRASSSTRLTVTCTGTHPPS